MKLYEFIDYLDDRDNVEKKELFYKECERVCNVLSEFSPEYKNKKYFTLFHDPDGETDVECRESENDRTCGEEFPKHLLFLDDEDIRKSCEKMYDPEWPYNHGIHFLQ